MSSTPDVVTPLYTTLVIQVCLLIEVIFKYLFRCLGKARSSACQMQMCCCSESFKYKGEEDEQEPKEQPDPPSENEH